MEKERSFGEQLNTWVQTVGIIIAAIWGVYTFIYKEVTVPRSAPINVTVNLSLKKIGTRASTISGKKQPAVAVEMRVSATNPSTRQISLLPSAWIVHGLTLAPNDEDDKTFKLMAEEALKNAENYTERFFDIGSTSIVALGELFSDEALKPNETIIRTIIFHVPANKFDLIRVMNVVPSAENLQGIKFEWGLTESMDLDPMLYKIDRKGNPSLLPKVSKGRYVDPASGYQEAISVSYLSLWQ